MRTRLIAVWWDLLRLSWSTQRWLTSLTLAAIVLSIVVLPISAVALRHAVDAMIAGDRSSALWAVVVAAVAYAGLYVVDDGSVTLRNAVTNRVARLEIEPMVHRAIADLPRLEHLERTDVLDRLKVIRDGAGQMIGGMWRVVLIISSVLKMAVALVLLGAVSPVLLPLLVLAVAPVWCQRRGQAVLNKAQLESAENTRLAQMLADLSVASGSGLEIRVSGAGEAIVAHQATAFEAAAQTRARAQFTAAALRMAGWIVFLAGFVTAVGWVAWSAVAGARSIGDLVLVIMIAASLHQTIQVAVNSSMATAEAHAVTRQYLWLRQFSEAERECAAGQPCPTELREGIRLEGVGFHYPGASRPALTDIRVDLPAGKIVAIVGEHGSGKSTLVKLLAKLYLPTSGKILVDSIDLNEVDTDNWRGRMSAAFQDFGRFSLTVQESVGIGLLNELHDEERVRRALEAADGGALLKTLPAGLNTQLGRALGGVELSEGQWQRIALARASLRRGPILFLLDEPTASLDALTEREIFSRYMTRARDLGARTGGITVVVSHRFSTVSEADLIIVLEEGRLVEQGSHHELLTRGGRYASQYQLQAAAYLDHRVARTVTEQGGAGAT